MGEPNRAWLRSDEEQEGLVLHLGGELDLASVPDLEPTLEELLNDRASRAEGQKVVVDVAGLEFLDSSGVAVLIRLANALGPIRLVHANPVVRRIVEVLSLAPHLGLATE